MLPIIDLHVTDHTAPYCYSLKKKLNIVAVKLPSITFDQQLDIKAYEIVRSKKLRVFVRLGGFH